MFTVKHRKDLEDKGYTVVEDVISADDCDRMAKYYDKWLSKFTADESWPFSSYSLIQRYNVGHAAPAWEARLATKPVFATLWGTEKLLTSFDAIAIGRPPETGSEEFYQPGQHWLHTDQSANQMGLHTIQGAVYLERADADDWTFVILQGSHQYHQDFMNSHPKALLRSSLNRFYRLRDGEPEWYNDRGCDNKRIPVPKGGLILWDSRLIHANARPIKGRENPNRWRRVIFTCMVPAIWASPQDIKEKQKAYNEVKMTCHHPAQSISLMSERLPSYKENIPAVTGLPEIAKCKEAKLLSGVIPYDFKDGKANGPSWFPQWRGGYRPDYKDDGSVNLSRLFLWGIALSLIPVAIYFGQSMFFEAS